MSPRYVCTQRCIAHKYEIKIRPRPCDPEPPTPSVALPCPCWHRWCPLTFGGHPCFQWEHSCSSYWESFVSSKSFFSCWFYDFSLCAFSIFIVMNLRVDVMGWIASYPTRYVEVVNPNTSNRTLLGLSEVYFPCSVKHLMSLFRKGSLVHTRVTSVMTVVLTEPHGLFLSLISVEMFTSVDITAAVGLHCLLADCSVVFGKALECMLLQGLIWLNLGPFTVFEVSFELTLLHSFPGSVW